MFDFVDIFILIDKSVDDFKIFATASWKMFFYFIYFIFLVSIIFSYLTWNNSRGSVIDNHAIAETYKRIN